MIILWGRCLRREGVNLGGGVLTWGELEWYFVVKVLEDYNGFRRLGTVEGLSLEKLVKNGTGTEADWTVEEGVDQGIKDCHVIDPK